MIINLQLFSLTASGNTVKESKAVVELIDELISRNNLIKKTYYPLHSPVQKIWMHVSLFAQLLENAMD